MPVYTLWYCFCSCSFEYCDLSFCDKPWQKVFYFEGIWTWIWYWCALCWSLYCITASKCQFCILFCWQILKFTQNVFMCWLQHHFFVVLRQMLEGRPEVSELHSIEGAKVPLMRFKFNGILVDFPYVQLPVINAAEVSISSFISFCLLHYILNVFYLLIPWNLYFYFSQNIFQCSIL